MSSSGFSSAFLTSSAPHCCHKLWSNFCSWGFSESTAQSRSVLKTGLGEKKLGGKFFVTWMWKLDSGKYQKKQDKTSLPTQWAEPMSAYKTRGRESHTWSLYLMKTRFPQEYNLSARPLIQTEIKQEDTWRRSSLGLMKSAKLVTMSQIQNTEEICLSGSLRIWYLCSLGRNPREVGTPLAWTPCHLAQEQTSSPDQPPLCSLGECQNQRWLPRQV